MNEWGGQPPPASITVAYHAADTLVPQCLDACTVPAPHPSHFLDWDPTWDEEEVIHLVMARLLPDMPAWLLTQWLMAGHLLHMQATQRGRWHPHLVLWG